jgi:hypothetical protein
MPGRSSWIPYAPERVKGFDDDMIMMKMIR